MKSTALILALVLSTACYAQSENPQNASSEVQSTIPATQSSAEPLPNALSTQPNSAANNPVTEDSDGIDVAKFAQECDNGNADSCLMLIQGYMKQDNVEEAKKYAQKGCDLNNSLSCGVLGIIAVTSGNNPKDSLTEASEYFEKGCRLGDPTSCKTLADIYKSGLIGEYPKEKITELYRRSCDIGLQAGCKALEHYEDQSQSSNAQEHK